ncbi:MAG: Ig domain-containing protein [Acidimicrobiales bacterium]
MTAMQKMFASISNRPTTVARSLILGLMLILPSICLIFVTSQHRASDNQVALTTTTITTAGETAYPIPSGATELQVTLVGAAGGPAAAQPEGSGAPGYGAEVQATITPPAGATTLYVEVGGVGATGGLFGGGGLGGGGILNSDGASGGGESAIQTCPVSAGGCTYTANASTDPRLLVAGGGGGGGEDGLVVGAAGIEVGGAGGDSGASDTVTGPGAGGAGVDIDGTNPGSTAGVADNANAASVGAGATLCGAGGDGVVGSATNGGSGGTCDTLDDSGGGGGGGGWVGGSGGGAGNYGDVAGDGGGGGAGASYVEGDATGVSVATATVTAGEVVITPLTLGVGVGSGSGGSGSGGSGGTGSIGSPSGDDFTVGVPGSMTVSANGFIGTTPSLSDDNATLPAGLTFTNNGNGTGTFSGTPAGGTGGSYPVTVSATNGVESSSNNLTITVGYVPGYVVASSTGGVYSFGDASYQGSMAGKHLNSPIVGVAETPTGGGYWLVASDGGVFSFGSAKFYGSMGGRRLVKPIVGIAPTPTGDGYWLVASDGGVFSFGDARFHGSTGAMRLNKPVVGMSPTENGQGYWLVASDGGVFSFGNAVFHGSTGAMKLVKPVAGMAVDIASGGYWLVAADGGVFCFDAPYLGRPGSSSPVVGVTSAVGTGYELTAANGVIYKEGNAPYFGSVGGHLVGKIVGIATPGGM